MLRNAVAMYIDENVARKLFNVKNMHGKGLKITSASKLASVLLGSIIGDEKKILEIWKKSNG